MLQELVWEDCRSPVDPSVIHAVETALGIEFPADYKAVILRCNGGHPKPYLFSYRDPDQGVRVGTAFAALLTVDEPGSPDNILSVRNDLDSVLPPEVIPFAEDGGGDYICFDYRSKDSGEAPSIVYWAHENPPSLAVITLAESFQAFLDMLMSHSRS